MYIGDFSFINQNSEIINQDSMLGNIYVADFSLPHAQPYALS